MSAPDVGDIAPDFEVQGVLGSERQNLRLSDYRGNKHVVLTFLVADWTPV